MRCHCMLQVKQDVSHASECRTGGRQLTLLDQISWLGQTCHDDASVDLRNFSAVVDVPDILFQIGRQSMRP